MIGQLDKLLLLMTDRPDHELTNTCSFKGYVKQIGRVPLRNEPLRLLVGLLLSEIRMAPRYTVRKT